MNKAIANAALCIGLLMIARALDASLFTGLLVIPFMLYALLANRTSKHSIAGSCILITGGSSGLGRAIAHEAALRGAKQIILVARTESKLIATTKIEALSSKVEATYICADLQDPESIRQMSAAVIEQYGTPDIIVNNAGAGPGYTSRRPHRKRPSPIWPVHTSRPFP